ncbi:MAG TPA: hypothetical protein VHT96_18370 [Clostridia bacterium]|nr:hypothetical protein [Clostridia bacterium]
MARILPVEYENASDAAREQFDDQIGKHGRITNMKRTLLHSLPAFHALMEWYPLRDEVSGFIGDRGVNYFCYAISSQNDCLICSTFFRRILVEAGEDPDAPVFSEEEQTLVDFGRCCVTEPARVDDELYGRLKKLYSDEQIVSLTAFAGLMIATNLINNALQVELDEYLVSYSRR